MAKSARSAPSLTGMAENEPAVLSSTYRPITTEHVSRLSKAMAWRFLPSSNRQSTSSRPPPLPPPVFIFFPCRNLVGLQRRLAIFVVGFTGRWRSLRRDSQHGRPLHTHTHTDDDTVTEARSKLFTLSASSATESTAIASHWVPPLQLAGFFGPSSSLSMVDGRWPGE